MTKTTRSEFARGVKDGLPIMAGYLAVAFTLGITAKNAGLTAFQTWLAGFLLNASAGEYAAFSAIATGASYIEAAIMVLVANARYLLMSFALSQKIAPGTPMWKRCIMGYDLTDEIFGVSVAQEGYVRMAYMLGVMSVALPGWSVGGMLGVVVGNMLSPSLMSALSVALYGMFIAVIIPPARQYRKILWLILISMALSFAARSIPALDFISDGFKTILLTVGISLTAALLYPVREVKA